jgi:hypothetical protein
VKTRLLYACISAELCGSRRVELEHLPPPDDDELDGHPFEEVVRKAFIAAGGDTRPVERQFGIGRSTAFRWRRALGLGRRRA